jgi:FtsH-binding integral membrane protein
VAAGVSIYFLLPFAVLSFDLGLLLEIFFLLLVGMILGLALISLNLQRLFEIAIVNTLLIFENKSMKILISKNLSSHRDSNKLTSLIFSLTLGCIIFIVVTASLQLNIFKTFPYGNIDTMIYFDYSAQPETVDPIL